MQRNNQKKNLNDNLNNNSNSRDELLDKFNKIILSLINILSSSADIADMQKMKLIIEHLIYNEKEKPLLCFIKLIYQNDIYRYHILEGNDSFFLGNDFEEYIKNDEKKESKIMKIFEFKQIWKDLDDSTKNTIKRSMVGLVKICQTYILSDYLS